MHIFANDKMKQTNITAIHEANTIKTRVNLQNSSSSRATVVVVNIHTWNKELFEYFIYEFNCFVVSFELLSVSNIYVNIKDKKKWNRCLEVYISWIYDCLHTPQPMRNVIYSIGIGRLGVCVWKVRLSYVLDSHFNFCKN